MMMMMTKMRFSDGIDIEFLACDDNSHGPTTELVLRYLSKKIVSINLFIKEISAFSKETPPKRRLTRERHSLHIKFKSVRH